MKRRGFTIIELLMVIAVISALMTIVTTAAMYSIRSSRERRTEAMRLALQAAIATYHAQDANGEWPGSIENLAKNAETAVLSESDAQEVFRMIVKKSIGASGTRNPLIDAAALHVAPNGVQDGRGNGMDFNAALKGDAHRSKLSVSRMVFGYPGKESGKFHRYNIVYNASTDSVKVSTCCHQCCGVNGCTKSGGKNRTACPVCHSGR